MKRRERGRFRRVKDKRNDEYISISVVAVAGERRRRRMGKRRRRRRRRMGMRRSVR